MALPRARLQSVENVSLVALQSFTDLHVHFHPVRAGLKSVEASFHSVKTDLKSVKTDVTSVKTVVMSVKADVTSVKAVGMSVKTVVMSVKADVMSVKTDVTSVKAVVMSVKTDVMSVKAVVMSVKAVVMSVLTVFTSVLTDVKDFEGVGKVAKGFFQALQRVRRQMTSFAVEERFFASLRMTSKKDDKQKASCVTPSCRAAQPRKPCRRVGMHPAPKTTRKTR
jgi:hypothetical protein